MLPANTAPSFSFDESQDCFSETLLDDDMDRLFSDNASDGPTSDTASDCSSDDSSVGNVFELSDIDDYDYDLNDLEDAGDQENYKLLVDSFCQQTSVSEQSSSVSTDKECSSTVDNSPPLLLAANSEAVRENVPNVSQSQPTMPNVSQSQPTTPNASNWNSLSHPFRFVIVGNNIDKNIRPSYQHQDRSTQSLHYFHSYVALNRIDISGLSDSHPSPTIIPLDKILPDNSERQKLLGDFEVLIARCIFLVLYYYYVFINNRVLVQNMEEFKAQKHAVQWHIKSDYCTEMASKSKVVCA